MRRPRTRQRRLLASLVLLAGSAATALALSSSDGSDEQRTRAQTPLASTETRTRARQPPASAVVSPEPAAARARAREFLTGYLALLHGRGSMPALRQLAASRLLRELRRNRARVTPSQHQSGSRILRLRVTLRSPASVRALAAVKERGGPPYALRLYLEHRGARWVVTRIGDA